MVKARHLIGGAGILVAVAGVLVLLTAHVPAAKQADDGSDGVPPFIQNNRCYRFTFSVTGAAPNWKVLGRAGDGWLRGQIDAGPASAQRETVWVNTNQILTAREARCSD